MALEIAEREDGIIVNADSMQVYSVLDRRHRAADGGRLSSARRTCSTAMSIPSIAYSTGAWLRDVSRIVGEGHARRAAADLRRRHRPLFPGAGRRHFRDAGDPGPRARPLAPASSTKAGRRKLHRILQRDDPEAALTLKPGDGQRIVRALEVLEASGRSILEWQTGRRHAADRPRERPVHGHRAGPALARRAHRSAVRRAWSSEGAIEEVKALIALDLDPALPAMKAIGVRELGMAIDGRISLAEAQRLAAIATRQYAKRQSTWFRNQLGPEWQRLTAPFA